MQMVLELMQEWGVTPIKDSPLLNCAHCRSSLPPGLSEKAVGDSREVAHTGVSARLL